MTIQHDLRAKNEGGEQNWKVHAMDYSKLKVFISAVCDLAPVRPEEQHMWSKNSNSSTPKTKKRRKRKDLCDYVIAGALSYIWKL